MGKSPPLGGGKSRKKIVGGLVGGVLTVGESAWRCTGDQVKATATGRSPTIGKRCGVYGGQTRGAVTPPVSPRAWSKFGGGGRRDGGEHIARG